MVDNDSSSKEQGASGVSRRRLVKALGATGVTAGLAGCGGGGGGGGDGGDGGGGTPTPGDGGGGGGAKTTMSGEIGGTVNIFSGKAYQDAGFPEVLHEAGVPDSVTINFTTGPAATGSKQQKLKIALNSQARDPDLVLTDNGWTIPFIVRGDLVNLSKEMPDEWVQDVKENAVQSMVKTGQHPKTGDLYSLPAFPDYPTMQYRKDLFKKAGYGESDFKEWQTNPPTWSEFSKVVSKAHGNADVDYGYLWQGNNYVGLACCTFNELLTDMGGYFFGSRENLFGPIGDRPVTIGSEKAIDAVELGRDLIYEGNNESPLDVTAVSPKEVLGWIEPDTMTQFGSEMNSVALRNWTYAIGKASSAFKGKDAELGVMPLPKGPNGAWHAQGGWILSMNPYSDNKPAAKEVMKAWWSDKFYKHQLDAANFMPAKPSLFSYVKQHPTYGPYFKPLQFSAKNLMPRPTTSVWPTQRSRVSTQVNAALRKEKSPKQAMNNLAKQIKAIEKQASG